MAEAAKVMDVTTLADVTRAVREIGLLEISVSTAENAMNKEIDAVKAKYAKTTALQNRIVALKAAVSDVCKGNMDWFGDARTLDTTWGQVEARKSPPAVEILPGWTEDRAIAKLEKEGPENGVETTKTIAKAVVKKMDPKDLAKFGIRLSSENRITVKPDKAKIAATISEADAKVA